VDIRASYAGKASDGLFAVEDAIQQLARPTSRRTTTYTPTYGTTYYLY
jgi:hypothetical protein